MGCILGACGLPLGPTCGAAAAAAALCTTRARQQLQAVVGPAAKQGPAAATDIAPRQPHIGWAAGQARLPATALVVAGA